MTPVPFCLPNERHGDVIYLVPDTPFEIFPVFSRHGIGGEHDTRKVDTLADLHDTPVLHAGNERLFADFFNDQAYASIVDENLVTGNGVVKQRFVANGKIKLRSVFTVFGRCNMLISSDSHQVAFCYLQITAAGHTAYADFGPSKILKDGCWQLQLGRSGSYFTESRRMPLLIAE